MRKNPFTDRTRRRTYDAVVECYVTRHRDIVYPDGSRCRGNSWATAFWRGYDGHTKPVWDRASKQTPGYACYRAGLAVRRAVDTGELPPHRVPQ